MNETDTQAAPLQVRVKDEMVEAAADAFDRAKYQGFTCHNGQYIRDFNRKGEEIWAISTGDYDRDHASMMRQLRFLQMRDALTAALDLSTPPQIAAPEAEIVKLRGERDEWRRCAEAEIDTRYIGDIAWEAEVARLTEALKPFAAMFEPMASNGKSDDRNVWGYNDAMLKHGDFRRAYDTLAALKESTNAD